MGSVVIYPPSPDILQRSRERAVKGRNARRLRRLALDGLARLCYFRQGGGDISSRAAPFPMNGKGRGDRVEHNETEVFYEKTPCLYYRRMVRRGLQEH